MHNKTIAELARLQEEMDRFDDQRLRISRELAFLLAKHVRIMAESRRKQKTERLGDLLGEAQELKRQLKIQYEFFTRHTYRKYMSSNSEFTVKDSLVQETKEDLVSRFESIIRPDVIKILDILEEFINRCKAAVH